MGVVWRAFDTVLNTDVALKMLLDSSDDTALQLFQQECSKHSALAHPNIVEIRDVGIFDEDGHHQPFLVMPLLRGTTLAAIIRSSAQPLSVERCIDIISQACRGLQAAHDFGLLHRDIKPSNLFVLEDDSVKIIDFGVAHRLEVSRTTGRKGTLLYMSPEQLNMKPLSRASDVFSLAVVCYEALTRRQPFLASTEEAVIEAICHLNPPPAASLNPKVSVSLSQVLCKAMAKDPRHRFASARELADYLRRAHYDDSFAVFDSSKFAPRLEKAADAYQQGSLEFAQELISELQSEGYLTAEVESLSAMVEASIQARTVAHLLESARARVQDGEYRLALQRVHAVLQLEPRHQDALVLQHDIEARHAEADIADWLRVSQQHLDKFSFAHARQAVQRILEVKPGEERALHFLQKVERRESEVRRIRDHKRQAYDAALEAERRNDLTSALTRMKEVLDLEREAPDLDEPGCLASYQSHYNKLHSEHETIASAYAEAKKALERDDHSAASRLCDTFLEKFPQHTLFRALKFDTEQRWRKAVSLRFIEVEEAAENEPDLDRRVRMLEDIVRDNPDLPEFSRLLESSRAKRDLVHGIVSRARELEARELYAEALLQWQTLQAIYPRFPELNHEIENTRLRRDLDKRVARKNNWITEINKALEDGDFERALQTLASALREFPGDSEFDEMRAYIRQNQELAQRAEQLVAEGLRLLNQSDLPAALEKLHLAYETGPGVRHAKSQLIDGLLRAARANQGIPAQAREYLHEVLALDPGNHAATGLVRFLDDQEEYRRVDETLAQARQLRSSNNVADAIALLERVSAEHPANARLRQMLRELDVDRSEIRSRDLQIVRRKRLEAAASVSLPSLNEHVAAVEQIAERYRDDEEFQQESRMVRARLHTIAATIAPAQPPLSATQPAAEEKRATLPHWLKLTPKLHWLKLAAKTPRPVFVTAAGLAALLLTGAFFWRHSSLQHHTSTAAAASVPLFIPVVVRATPRGVRILHDGKLLGVASPSLQLHLPPGKLQFEAQLDGYEPQSRSLEISPGHTVDLSFTLAPVTQQFRVLGEGAFSLDGGPVTRLSQGMFSGELSAGNHAFHWLGRSGYHPAFHIAVEDGKPAAIDLPPAEKYSDAALLVSIASRHTQIYTTASMPLTVDGAEHGTAGPAGVQLDLAPGLHTIEAGNGTSRLTAKVESGPDRLLLLSFRNAPALGSLTVLSDTDGVTLSLLRGKTVLRTGTTSSGRFDMTDLPAGRYLLHATPPSSQPLDPQTVVISKSQAATISLRIKKAPTLLPVRIHTLPGASILVDGAAAGITGADGNLLVPALAVGQHHLEARRKGNSAALDLNLQEGQSSPSVAELNLENGPALVTLQLNPSSSVVTVYNSKGEPITINGQHFPLPEGQYRFIARFSGYSDREQVVDLAGDTSRTIDLTLSPIAVSSAPPTTAGWQSGLWSADSAAHTITNGATDFALNAIHPTRGTFLFAGSIGRGFFISKPKVEWVVNYRDPANYLLFTLEHDGLQLSVVHAGKKTPHGTRIPFPSLSKYQIMLQIAPAHIVTSLNSGQGWKQLSDWSGLPDDVDAGQFGFHGPVTLTSFTFVP